MRDLATAMIKREPSVGIETAARLLAQADALLITAGAGMGVDSGLPDFRGPGGFWGVYPALGRAGLCFEEVASPKTFIEQPTLAWGFYGHRLNLYRQTPPGRSFDILREIAQGMPYGAFVFTSNVDGHFQKAGFPSARVCEVHGSIHHLQCLNRCSDHIWSASYFTPEVDEENCRLVSDLPTCPHCGGMARPNILMFGDWYWNSSRQAEQMAALNAWLEQAENPVVIEIGAGTAIPTVRHFGERLACPMIRINKTESDIRRSGDVGLPLGGIEAMTQIQAAMTRQGQNFN